MCYSKPTLEEKCKLASNSSSNGSEFCRCFLQHDLITRFSGFICFAEAPHKFSSCPRIWRVAAEQSSWRTHIPFALPPTPAISADDGIVNNAIPTACHNLITIFYFRVCCRWKLGCGLQRHTRVIPFSPLKMFVSVYAREYGPFFL